jgi:hypothetical protein
VVETDEGGLNRSQIVEIVPEPSMDRVEGSRVTSKVVVSGVSGHPTFELISAATASAAAAPVKGAAIDGDKEARKPLSEISFEETLMYQTREFTARLANTGPVRFPFSFHVANDDMNPERRTRVPYSVTPSEGVLMPGTSVDVVVSFAPTEVGTSEALLTCDIPHSAPGAHRVSVDLTGVAKRPVCHVDLPDSAYLKQDRSTLKGATGTIGEIDMSKIAPFFRGLRVTDT